MRIATSEERNRMREEKNRRELKAEDQRRGALRLEDPV